MKTLPTLEKYSYVDSNKSKEKKAKKEYQSHCSICGKGLTDERSIKAGFGPVCMANRFSENMKNYKQNMFILGDDMKRKLPDFTMKKHKNVYFFFDEDSCELCPSVTNGIDDIIDNLSIDTSRNTIVTVGTDGMWTEYKNGNFTFLGWSENEAIEFLKEKGKL